jgi:hypothetical protein
MRRTDVPRTHQAKLVDMREPVAYDEWKRTLEELGLGMDRKR